MVNVISVKQAGVSKIWNELAFLIPLFPFFVMCQSSSKEEETVQLLPSDTIPMQYIPRYPSFLIPILDGIVNDSLHFNVFFDTGTTVNHFSISDNLKNLFDSDSAFVQIGKIKKQMDIGYLGSSERSFFDSFGKNTILVGWRFFENKIIALDFQNQHILVYESLPNVVEYSKFKITLFRNAAGNAALLIPAQVRLQGKTIQDTFNIDTGCNNYMVLSKKHIEEQGIDTTNALYGKSTVSGGRMPKFSIPADTLKIGDLYVAKQNMRITFDNSDYKGSGLLGTPTMQNFSVILDLINYDLYLKNIENLK
jgi:hypothetical protein